MVGFGDAPPERGGWGATLAPDTGTFVLTDYQRDRFLSVLTAHT